MLANKWILFFVSNFKLLWAIFSARRCQMCPCHECVCMYVCMFHARDASTFHHEDGMNEWQWFFRSGISVHFCEHCRWKMRKQFCCCCCWNKIKLSFFLYNCRKKTLQRYNFAKNSNYNWLSAHSSLLIELSNLPHREW
jgi:hypothetical protein